MSGLAPRNRLGWKQALGHSHKSQEQSKALRGKDLGAVGAYNNARFGAGSVETSAFSRHYDAMCRKLDSRINAHKAKCFVQAGTNSERLGIFWRRALGSQDSDPH